MRVKIHQLDGDIRSVVCGQADTGHDGRRELKEAQLAIHQLFERIRNIKEKAEHSEHMVSGVLGSREAYMYVHVPIIIYYICR